ncbi:MAG: sulfite exporter TauE/SafE family protein [Octadecabacter sp.]
MNILGDPTVLMIAMAAYFIGGILKGAMGFGLPILAIPVMTVTHSLPIALSVAILPTVLTNIAQLWTFRAHRDVSFLPKFLIAGAFGLCLGAVMLSRINNAYIEIALGVMVLAYLVNRLRPAAAPRVGRPDLGPYYGFLAGMVHGSTGLSGLVGPPYMHAMNLPRPKFVFATGSMFTLFSLMQAPVLFSLGLFHQDAVWISLAILPFAFTGLYFGGVIGARMQSDTFSRLVLGVLGVTAILPIFNGLRSLFFV